MIKPWRVSLELGRDDGAPLSDEGIGRLTQLLTGDRIRPVIAPGDSGAVVAQLTIEATNDMAARSAAEAMLRDRANTVWTALGLPPFTIAFVGIEEEGEG